MITQSSTFQIVRGNLARIRILAVHASILLQPKERARLQCVLQKFVAWELPAPIILIGVRNDEERAAAQEFSVRVDNNIFVVTLNKSTTLIGEAISAYKYRIGGGDDPKRHILELARRGGSGRPNFIEPFTGGAGTTCGAWTPIVDYDQRGRPIRGFMKAVLARGFCPVECPFCYLQSPYMDAMTIYLNWEDLAAQLSNEWAGYSYPLNFSEIGGFVEYDRWFAGTDGEGSMVQFVIDACAASDTMPFFLTKIAYPRYLNFKGHVQVGISLMPEPIRKIHAPHGSPADDLLDSLAWAWSAGAHDPTIRLFMLWEQRDLYRPLLEQCREILGDKNWRLTLDIPRFTPRTATRIAGKSPEAAAIYASELDPTGQRDLRQLGRDGREAKKVRPPVERQAEIYCWVHEQLKELGCEQRMLTPCKGDPNELAVLVPEGVIQKMPCACHKSRGITKQLVQLDVSRP